MPNQKDGAGIFSAKLDFSNKVKKALKKHGDKKITAIRISRVPIEKIIEKALNVISLGKWSKLKDKYSFDVLFHLSLQLTLEDGTVLAFEKIDIVDLTEEKTCSKPTAQCREISYPQNSLTVSQMVEDPLKSIPKEEYFKYSSFKFNCQEFVSKILAFHKLLTPADKTFIYQDISQIVKELPFFTSWGANLVTGAIAFKKKITGAGLACTCSNCISSGGCMDCDKCPDKIKKMESTAPEEMSIVEKRKQKIEDKKKEDLEVLTDFVLNEIF